MPQSDWRPSSLAAQGLGWIEPETGAISPPIHMSSTYQRDADNSYGSTGRVYIRDENPSFDQAQALLARLEGGAAALLFASGMGAATATFMALRPGDHVVVPAGMYWALRNWLKTFAEPWGLAIDTIDMTDLDALRRAVRPGQTRLVWVETPANPMWSITDLAGVAEIAHAAGARVAADSTVATPVFCRPIEFGIDIVMHSATKYLNGHSDICAGALITRETDEFWKRIQFNRSKLGAIIGSFEAWLLLRGMRSLFPRVERSAKSAMTLAELLAAHRHVSAVLYPGLKNFPGHAVAAKQMQGGFGGMLSIRVRDPLAACAKLRVWVRATSLGGVESLIEHRASVEGPTSPTPKDLLRLSVGLEHEDDLFDDLAGALR
jgi:cystathionine gamma-synthase